MSEKTEATFTFPGNEHSIKTEATFTFPGNEHSILTPEDLGEYENAELLADTIKNGGSITIKVDPWQKRNLCAAVNANKKDPLSWE
jgi:hypothetical protein